MAYTCDLTGKRRLVGNNVSHAKNRTKKNQKPNLHSKRVFDSETGRTVRMNLSSQAIRTLDKLGGYSQFSRKKRK